MRTANWIEGPCTIWQLTLEGARKVWQGTPEDARAGRGHVTEEPTPEIPPCKYPVGTVLVSDEWVTPVIIRRATPSWVYGYESTTTVGRHSFGGDDVPQPWLDRHSTIVQPDPYPVGSEHVVDLGLLGRQTAKVVSRDGDLLSFVVVGHQQATGVAWFEKAVVK
jgi:hypothetical protein